MDEGTLAMSKVEFDCPDCDEIGEVFYIDTRGGRILCKCKDIQEGIVVDNKVTLSLIQHLLYEVEELKDEIRQLRNE